MSTKTPPAPTEREKREHLEDRIDESLEETFPASDPPAVHPPALPRDSRQAPSSKR